MKEYLSANGINNETNLPMIEESEVNICMKYLKKNRRKKRVFRIFKLWIEADNRE